MNDEMMMMISRLAEAGSRGVVQDSGGSKSIEAMLAQIANTGSMGVLRDVGESKSIDDIINQADMAEFLSKAMADKTNVDSSQMPMKKDRLKYSSDTIIDFLNSLGGGYREPGLGERMRSQPGRLRDLARDKPLDS
jgi:hypothetical protein